MAAIQYDMILIDANSIGYAAHSARVLKHTSGEVQAIFFGLKMIKRALDEYSTPGHTQVQVLWDSRAKWRYALHPEYKGKRDDDPVKKASRKEYKRQVPFLRKALSMLGVDQRISENEEADDLAAAIVHNNPGKKILLVSGDQDWLALVNIHVDWYDPREDGKHVNQSCFVAATGFANVVQFTQAKAILGDSSDNIKGPAGLGDKAFAAIIQHWGGIPGLMKWVATLPSGKKEFDKGELPAEFNRHRMPMSVFCFGEGLDIFKRNMKLMNLLGPRHRGTEIIDKQVILKTALDEAAFTDFCHEFAFMSITKTMQQWVKTFG